MKAIIGIDPGKGGGIAVYTKGRTTAVSMPDTVDELKNYLVYLRDTYDNPVVFIEKVQAWGAGDDAPGKKFGINKMLKQYTELLTVIVLMDFIYIEVYPVTWQTTLGFKEKRPKDITPEKWKTIRKSQYKKYAKKYFPMAKVNLTTSDALCLVAFALEKKENDFEWIMKHSKKEIKQSFFGKKGKTLF